MNNALWKAAVLVLLCSMSYSTEIKASSLQCSEVPPGGDRTPAAPGVVTFINTDQTGHLDVFIEGTDNRILENEATVGPWTEVPGHGQTDSQPSGVFFDFTEKVFVRGIDNGIYENDLPGKDWAQVPGGGLTLSGPFAIVKPGFRSDAEGILKLFVRGLDNGIWENDFTNSTWTGWCPLPGNRQTISTPTAVKDGLAL